MQSSSCNALKMSNIHLTKENITEMTKLKLNTNSQIKIELSVYDKIIKWIKYIWNLLIIIISQIRSEEILLFRPWSVNSVITVNTAFKKLGKLVHFILFLSHLHISFSFQKPISVFFHLSNAFLIIII